MLEEAKSSDTEASANINHNVNINSVPSAPKVEVSPNVVVNNNIHYPISPTAAKDPLEERAHSGQRETDQCITPSQQGQLKELVNQLMVLAEQQETGPQYGTCGKSSATIVMCLIKTLISRVINLLSKRTSIKQLAIFITGKGLFLLNC